MWITIDSSTDPMQNGSWADMVAGYLIDALRDDEPVDEGGTDTEADKDTDTDSTNTTDTDTEPEFWDPDGTCPPGALC